MVSGAPKRFKLQPGPVVQICVFPLSDGPFIFMFLSIPRDAGHLVENVTAVA